MGKEEFEKLFRNYYSAMVQRGVMLLKDEAEAEDVVSDIFAKIWDRNITIPKERPLSYLLACVRNSSLDLLSQRPPRMRIESLLTLQTLPEVTDREDTEQAIRLSIASDLTEQDRRVLLMRYEEKLKNREIAEKLHISEAAVYKHLAKALQTLRTKVRRAQDEE